MNRRALLLPLALAASVCLHMAGAAAFLGKNEDMQIEGAAPTALTIIGNAFEDAAKAGEESAVEEVVPSADVQPVEEVAEGAPAALEQGVDLLHPGADQRGGLDHDTGGDEVHHRRVQDAAGHMMQLVDFVAADDGVPRIGPPLIADNTIMVGGE